MAEDKDNNLSENRNHNNAFSFTPPAPFDFTIPELWDRWLKRFERFRLESGLKEQSEEKQVTTLIYCLGEEAEDIISAFKLNETEKTSYKMSLNFLQMCLLVNEM